MNILINRWHVNMLMSLSCLAIFAGCAQTFNNSSLSELVTEPATHKDFPVRERAALSDLKMDPLDFAPHDKLRQADLPDEQDWQHVTDLPTVDIDPKNEAFGSGSVTTIPTAVPTESPVPPPSIIQLEPMLPEEPMLPAEPIEPIANNSANNFIEPINDFVEQPIQLQAKPTTPSNDQPISIPAYVLAPVNISPAAEQPEDDSTAFSPANFEPANEPANERDFTPIASESNRRILPEPEPLQISEMPFESPEPPNVLVKREQPQSDFTSEQMQMMLPPFAHHPDIQNFANESTADSTDTDTENENENLNDFVEALISSSIDPSQFDSVTPSSAKETKFVATPAAPIEPTTWSDRVTQTIEAFETEIDDADGQRRENLERGLAILQALQSSLTQTNEDSASTHDLQQYWTHQLKALKSIMQSDASSGEFNIAATSALSHLNQAASGLRNSADLLLRSECFCRKVDGFGQYETFEDSLFEPQQQVLVYCELENFTPLQETAFGDTNFKTKISSSFWITNAQGETVQTTDYPAVTDNARNLRRDFFMHLPIRFADLEPGSYELQVEVRDFGSGKSAKLDAPLQFRIR